MVDDFIHNLRNQQNKRKQMYNNPYKTPDNRSGKDNRRPEGRRFPDDQLVELIKETVPVIRNLLKEMADNQKRLSEVEEMRARAEERMATAMESIAFHLRVPETLEAEEKIEEICSSSPDAELVAPEKVPPQEPDAPDKDQILGIIAEMRNSGATYDQIAFHLEQEKVPTLSGRGRWHPQTVHRACRMNHPNLLENGS